MDFVTADVNDLLELFETNEELTTYLINPLYDASSKKTVLEKVIARNSLTKTQQSFYGSC